MSADVMEARDAGAQSGVREDASDVPAGYKRTEVGVIPEGWDVLLVREAFDYLSTTSYSRAQLKEAGDLAYVHYGDIHTRFQHFIDFDVHDLPFLPDRADVSAALLRDGDLIIADASEDEAGVGKSVEIRNLGGGRAISGLHTLALRAKDERTATGYRAYLFEKPAVKDALRRVATGLKVFGISKTALNDLPLPLPPPSEQRAIAEALSDVDGLLGALEALIAKKRAIKQATMQQLLTGKTRLPGFSGAWETRRLGEVGTFAKGRGIKRTDVIDEGLPCIRYGELYTRYENYVTNPVSRVSVEVAETALPIRHGDLLFAGSGETAEEIGSCAAYLGNEEAYAGGDIVVLTTFGQDPMYLGHLMNHPAVAIQKARLGQGDAVVHISAGNLAQVEVLLPPRDEQTAIATVLSDMDAEIAALERRRDKTRAIKQGMMQQLLTGRVRLVAPEAQAPEVEGESVAASAHSKPFNEAVIISVLAKHFGSEKYPLGRMRYTKLGYLLHRHTDGDVRDYLKKAAGPYNPKTRYGGGENIALEKGYIRKHLGPLGHEGFVAAKNVAEAEGYFEKWYGSHAIPWVKQFRFKNKEQLELITTVDSAAEELRERGQAVDVHAVKAVIRGHSEWKAKLKRPVFSDANIADAIGECQALFGAPGSGDAHD